jgi:dihydroxyacetone kinase DhaKLM complex PTS-EIIA-like component DhaM
MSAEMALEMLPAEQRQHSILSDAPFVEGAVEASLGKTLRDVATAAVAVCEMPKVTQQDASAGA